jgi:hypothetical protein
LAVARVVALPHMSYIAHGFGRFGPDPASARLVALETHGLYTLGGARIPPKIRDRLLSFALQQEAAVFRTRRRQWIEAMREARLEHAWLCELREVQRHMRVSPAQQQLDAFPWPIYPLHRCLLTANEMRLVVWVGFYLLAEERSGGGASTAVATATATPPLESSPSLPSETATSPAAASEQQMTTERADAPPSGTATAATDTASSDGNDDTQPPLQPPPLSSQQQHVKTDSGHAASLHQHQQLLSWMAGLQAQLQLPGVSVAFLSPSCD